MNALWPMETRQSLLAWITSETKKGRARNSAEIANHFKMKLPRTKGFLTQLRIAGDIKSAGIDEGQHAWVSTAKRNPASATKKALAKARAWYWDEDELTDPKPVKGWKPPEACIEAGHIVAIEYESRKDGQSHVYRHDVTKSRRLYISTDGTTLIVQPGFKITTRGIEG